MKYDQLIITGLPKSFDSFKALDYLQPEGSIQTPEQTVYDLYPAECDEALGEEADIIFKYNESSTGVYMVRNQRTQTLTLHLSEWASEADVLLYAALVNTILQKHKKAKLFDSTLPLAKISEKEVAEMINERNEYLKRLIKLRGSFVMEGLNSAFTLNVEHLRPAPTIEMQAYDLQRQFIGMQWGNEEE